MSNTSSGSAEVHPEVHLAQINIGTMRAPVDDPMVAEFMNNLDRINAMADNAEGFVWRLQTESGNATSIQVFANPLELLNMSVFRSVESLKAYVYQSEHVDFFRRRAEWFEADAKRVALWWIPGGHVPDPAEGVHRVEFLEKYGPSPYAFGFARPPAPMVFETTTPNDPDTQQLISALNNELMSTDPDPTVHHFGLADADVTGSNGVMLRIRFAGELVGCGAIRRIDDSGAGSVEQTHDAAELKRMYVNKQSRGNKFGAALLHELEFEAKRKGFTELRLETGAPQVEAIGLYEKAGFTRCDPWGEYLRTADSSLCFSKQLT